MPKIQIPNDWAPRNYQLPAWDALVNKGVRRSLLVWHRRAGKDAVLLNALAVHACRKVGYYWAMAPKANQSRKIYFDNVDASGQTVIDHVIPKEIRARTDRQSMTIQLFNGSIIQLCGSDNYDTLVGANPIGVVFTEYSLSDPTAWAYIRPILLENDGFAFFNGTPRGENHMFKMYEKIKNNPKWFVSYLTVDDTGVLTKEEIQAEIDEEGMDEDKAQQEFYCSWKAPVAGSYYGAHLKKLEEAGHIGSYPYQRSHAVHTAWDLGVSDATCIWFFQIIGGEKVFIDYYENNNQDLTHYAKIVKDKPYNYIRHHLPHDATVREYSLPGTPTREKILSNNGVNPIARVFSGPGMRDMGIDAVRRELPNCRFDAIKCKDGISALKNYARKFDEVTQTFKREPDHSWASNGADAFRMAIVGCNPLFVEKPKGNQQEGERNYDVLNY